MKSCPKCKQQIPANSKTCPYCGKKTGKKKGAAIIAIILILAVAAGAFFVIKNYTDILPGSDKGETTTAVQKPSRDNEVEYIKETGKIVVGVTDFAPCSYKDGDEWIGFDADMAKEFAEYLGVEVEFKEITWSKKTSLLDDRTIDCVWSGMPLTEDVQKSMSCSDPYISSNQVLVMNKTIAGNYKTVEDCASLTIAVVDGSTGESIAKDNGFNYIVLTDEAAALLQVREGAADAAIIDSTFVGAMTGDGTVYRNIVVAMEFDDEAEEWAVGFRKGSDLAEEYNKFYAEKVADGTVDQIAMKYGVEHALIK